MELAAQPPQSWLAWLEHRRGQGALRLTWAEAASREVRWVNEAHNCHVDLPPPIRQNVSATYRVAAPMGWNGLAAPDRAQGGGGGVSAAGGCPARTPGPAGLRATAPVASRRSRSRRPTPSARRRLARGHRAQALGGSSARSSHRAARPASRRAGTRARAPGSRRSGSCARDVGARRNPGRADRFLGGQVSAP